MHPLSLRRQRAVINERMFALSSQSFAEFLLGPNSTRNAKSVNQCYRGRHQGGQRRTIFCDRARVPSQVLLRAQEQLDQAGLITRGAILEMEYQKSSRHGIRQRPDIIFHIPAEHSRASVRENNFAVWALKRRASSADALADFDLLDEMFEALSIAHSGFFLNIDSADTMRQHYHGRHGNRLAAVAATLVDGRVQVNWDTAA